MNSGAFFDIDGTLLPPPSLEQRFFRFLRRRGAIGWKNYARWLGTFARRVWTDPLLASQGNKAYLAGVCVAELEAWQRFLRSYPLRPYPAARERIEWHRAQRHTVYLMSGTLLPLAQEFARALSVHVCATELESEDGVWTGCVHGEAICGPEKLRVMERLAEKDGIDLQRSYAYADRIHDRWVLERVGTPVAVNPDARLERLAQQRGWPVVHWRGGPVCVSLPQNRREAFAEPFADTGSAG